MIEEVLQKEEINKLNYYGKMYALLLTITIISSAPLFMWLGTWAIVPWGIIFISAMFYALKIEKVKKENDIQTYKEIKAFSKGHQLDEIQKRQEIAKRPYEKIFMVMVSVVIAVVVSTLIGLLMHIFLN